MNLKKRKADPEYDEESVKRAVRWQRGIRQSANELHYDENLAGPDGASYVVFATKETSDEQIEGAIKFLKATQDVVGYETLIVPAEWLQEA